MKRSFKKSIGSVLCISAFAALQLQAVVALPENDGACPDTTIPGLNNLTTHTSVTANAVINDGWDSDKYGFTPGSDGTVKITYTAPKATSVKIDYDCGGSGIYRKADGDKLANGEVEFPVTADQSVHVGIWNWDSGDTPYEFSLNVEFIPENDTTDNNNTDTGSGTDNNSTDNGSTTQTGDAIIYEDAEDGNIDGWQNISPYIGSITNTDTGENKVITLTGTTDQAKNRASYAFGSNWNNTEDFIAKWDMKSDTDYEIMFIAKSDDDPSITNYIGYVNKIPTLSGYSFDPSTGYWSDSAHNVQYDWGRYVYNVIDTDTTTNLTTITRDLQADASILGVGLTSIESMWVNVYGDSSKYLQLDNITLQKEETTSENTPPQAFDVSASVDENQTVTVDLNATDADTNDTITYTITNAPTDANYTLAGNQLIFHAPFVDANQTVQFTYNAKDSKNASSNDATIIINVIDIPAPVTNQAPSADDISASVDQNDTLTIQPSGNDAENQALTFIVQTQPEHGSLDKNSTTDTFIYTPIQDFNGTDSFTYVANDGDLNSSPATVSITINAVSPDQNDTNATQATINVDENQSIEVNCAGQLIEELNQVDSNKTVVISGNLTKTWDSDVYSFVTKQGATGKVKITVTDNDGNSMPYYVTHNCIVPMTPNSDGTYTLSESGQNCGLISIVVAGCAQAQKEYTLKIEYIVQ